MRSIALCVPVYQSAAFLPTLLERLRELVPRPAELLVLDDASTDASGALLSAFATLGSHTASVRVLRNQVNRGIGATYNRLVLEATSDWVHILDADDYPVEADFYARVAPHLTPNRDLVVTSVRSNSRLLNCGVSTLGWIVPDEPPPWLPLLGSFATRSGVLYRRQCLLSVPFPDPAFPGSDLLHMRRLRRANNCVFVRGAHVFYRVHPEASSTHNRDFREYRAGLASFEWATRLCYGLDLRMRAVGQRFDRQGRGRHTIGSQPAKIGEQEPEEPDRR